MNDNRKETDAVIAVGRGRHLRQKNIIAGAISNGNLFPAIAAAVDKDLDKFVKRAQSKIEKILDTAVKRIREDVLIGYAKQKAQKELDDEDAEIGDGGQAAPKLAKGLQQKVLVGKKELRAIESNLSRLT